MHRIISMIRHQVSETEIAEKAVPVVYHDTTVFERILRPAAAVQQSAQNQDTAGD